MSSHLALAVIALVDVRFEAHWGLYSDIAPCPLSAINGHQQAANNRIHALFAQPTPSQISKRETVTTDIAVEITTAEDTVSTCTLYCCAMM